MTQWIQGVVEWARNIFEQAGIGPVGVFFAFLLGLFGAFASACCTLPVFGAIIGYSGTRKEYGRRTIIRMTLLFMLGTVIATVILGCLAGSIGQLAQTALGRYWKLGAGVLAILIGLVALKLLPVKLPQFKTKPDRPEPKGFLGAAVFGLVVGGGMVISSMPCNPALFIVLGVAFLNGFTLWTIALISAYALGFAIPLTALMLGVSFGKSALKMQKAEAVIRITAGIILIAAGFYFLKTL